MDLKGCTFQIQSIVRFFLKLLNGGWRGLIALHIHISVHLSIHDFVSPPLMGHEKHFYVYSLNTVLFYFWVALKQKSDNAIVLGGELLLLFCPLASF